MTFVELVASRKQWIEDTLRPWCHTASPRDLRMAEMEWPNLAGQVDPSRTLWMWAWDRFPGLVHPEFHQIDESHAVTVHLKSGEIVCGYPDGRRAAADELVILPTGTSAQPRHFTLEEIERVECAARSESVLEPRNVTTLDPL